MSWIVGRKRTCSWFKAATDQIIKEMTTKTSGIIFIVERALTGKRERPSSCARHETTPLPRVSAGLNDPVPDTTLLRKYSGFCYF